MPMTIGGRLQHKPTERERTKLLYVGANRNQHIMYRRDGPLANRRRSRPGAANSFILVAATVLLLAPSPSLAGSIPNNIGVRHVIHMVMDGLRSDNMLKPELPNFSKLMEEGSCTLNARHDWASSQTLPNHIGMFTGLIIDEHGYKEDKDHGGELIDADGQPFENIFDLVAASGGTTAFYGSKDKFAVFERSWKMDHYEMQLRAKNLVPMFLEDMNAKTYTYAFLHVRSADRAGHKDAGIGMGGAFKPLYMEAVQEADGYLGQVMELIEQNDELRGSTAIIVTADHGFSDYGNHGDEELLENFRIPYCAYGPGVQAGADLGKINSPSQGGIIVDPGISRGGEYDPIIRNSYSAVLAADFLGIEMSDGPFSNQYLSVGDRPAAATGDVIEVPPVVIAEKPDDKPADNPEELPEPEETEEDEELIPVDEEVEDNEEDASGVPSEEDENEAAEPDDTPRPAFDWEQWLIDRPHWNQPSLVEDVTTTEQPEAVVAPTEITPTVVLSEEILLSASEYTSIAEEMPDKPYKDKSIVIGEGIDALILFEMPQELDDTTIGSTVLELRVLEGEYKFKDAKVYQTTGNWLDRTVGWDNAPAAEAELGKLVSWENAEGDIYATVELSRNDLKIMDGRLLLRIEPKKKDLVVFDPDAKLSVKYTK